MYNKIYKFYYKRQRKIKMDREKKYFAACILFIIGIFICVFTTDAFATGDNTPENSAAPISPSIPTPKKNIIGSIGNISLTAEYIDNGLFEENSAINAEKNALNDISEDIFNAIREQDRNRDIFSIFKLSLVCNGRETGQKNTLCIKIDRVDVFAEYEDICIFLVSENNTVKKIDTVTENDFFSFNMNNAGTYIAAGIAVPSESPIPTEDTSINTTLPNYSSEGIITLSPTNQHKQSIGDSEITPGAFVFWIAFALVFGVWVGIGIGFILWGRYKSKKIQRGPNVIGE